MAVWSEVKLSDIKSDRFDADYFQKYFIENINLLQRTGSVATLGKSFKYIKRGIQPKYSGNGTIKVLRSVNVGFLSFNEKRQEYVTPKFMIDNFRGKVVKNDILITSTGVGTLGRTSIWYSDEEAHCDGHITILRDTELDPYFVSLFLNTNYGITQFNQHYRGSSGQIEIYPYDISKFIIPSILINYQKEIGNLVKKSFNLIDLSQSLYTKAQELLERELGLNNSDLSKTSNKYESSFHELTDSRRFDTEYYNPKVKQIVKRISTKKHSIINNHFNIKNGFPWNSKKFMDNNAGDPVIRIRDVKPTYIDNDILTSIETKYCKTISFPKGQCGDIVIGMDGLKYFYAALIEEPCSINQRVCHLTPKQNSHISSEYAAFIINSEIGQAQLLRDMTIATTVGHITNRHIAKLILPIVSDEFHNSITNLIRESVDAKKQSKQLLEQAKRRVEELIEKAVVK